MLNRRAFLCGFLSFAAAAGLPGGVAGAMAAGLKVMASSYPVWLLTRDVTARTPGLTPELLVAASAGCPHDYTLTPRDMLRLSSSSTLIINGRGFEAFLSSALDQLKKLSVIDAGGNIPALPEDDDHHDGSDHHDEHEHHHDHPHGNPHYFSSPARAAVMVKNIAEGLASLATGEAAVLRATGSELEGRLNKLGEEVAKLGKSGSGVDFILQHDALSWFFHDAGLSVMGVLQEEADEPPSAAALGALVKKMKAGKKRCIVVIEPQFPERVARSLARDAGAGLISLDPLASGPANPPAGYYEKVMAANVAALTKVLRDGAK